MTSFYGGGAASTSGGGGSSAKGALIFKGTLGISDDGATVLVLPDTHEEGWTYLVVTAGTYAGQLCEKGDFVICVSSGESASDLDWTVVQGNTFNTLPNPTASDEGKIIAVDALGNYTLIDNPVDNKLDKNNGTATGTTTFDKAQANRLELLVDGESIGGFRSIDLTPAVTDNGDDSSMRFVPLFIGEPTKDAHAATKKYVDDKTQTITQSVEAETERATEAETTLQTAIDTEVADRTAADAATNETIQNINQDIDNIKNDYLPLNGSLGMEGDLNANSHSITNLMPPVNGGDASNKQYTDAMDTNTLSDAKSYADTKAEQVVSEARTYTDAKVAEYLPLEGGVMTGVVSMGNNRIEDVPTPIDDSHVANKKYVDDKAGNYLPLAGGTMTGSINVGENTVTNLKEPENGTDATTKNYVDDEVAKATNNKIDAVYNLLVRKAETVDEVNQLFKDWWNANWEDGYSTYNDMLERWFGKVLDDDKVYGVKLPLFETSTSPQGAYIVDSVGAIVTPATEEDPGQNDFAKTPQFWCVEVAAEKNANGSHTIYACEYIDDIDVVRNGGPDNGNHLVWVLQKNTYVREQEAFGYSYIHIQCHPAEGFVQWPQGTDRTGHIYSYIGNPKYAAGIDDEGNIGGRTGLKPTSYMSMNETIQAWRARGPQYSGSSACFYKWAYIMFALLTAKKGEDVGCNNYNLQYTAAVSESGVFRIILTADQANNLYIGSNVIVGNTEDNNDRNQAAMYSLVNQKRISSIEEVIIEEDASSYKAVYIDVPEGTTFNTTAGTTYISTMPYYSGWTDTVKGTIGTRYGTNLNKQPFLLQKVELMNGAYNYASDELDQWSQQDDTHYLYNYYLCEDQTKVSTNGTITDDYVKKENAIITIDTSVYTTNNNWYYIEDNLADNNFKMLNPKKFSTSAGSGTGTRDAFYLSYAASGVRAPVVWSDLWGGGPAGISCRRSYSSPSWTDWDCAGGCPGLSG